MENRFSMLTYNTFIIIIGGFLLLLLQHAADQVVMCTRLRRCFLFRVAPFIALFFLSYIFRLVFSSSIFAYTWNLLLVWLFFCIPFVHLLCHSIIHCNKLLVYSSSTLSTFGRLKHTSFSFHHIPADTHSLQLKFIWCWFFIITHLIFFFFFTFANCYLLLRIWCKYISDKGLLL